jgi:hypothetical protein
MTPERIILPYPKKQKTAKYKAIPVQTKNKNKNEVRHIINKKMLSMCWTLCPS